MPVRLVIRPSGHVADSVQAGSWGQGLGEARGVIISQTEVPYKKEKED